MYSTEDFADLVASVELALNKSFKDSSLTILFAAVESRLNELKAPADQESTFDAASLERGILKNLLQKMTEMGGFSAVSLKLH